MTGVLPQGRGSALVRVCAACGGASPEGFRHCGFCGAALAEPAVERRMLATLVFCDLAGSTALAERVDPESVRGLLQAYFGEMRVAVEAHGGVVEKFIGDAVVGVFGVPQAHEDDALRACRAALEMLTRLERMNEELERRFGVRIAIRVGVNTGEVVGNRETFVTGDAVNVAARLEQAAASGEALIGETTYRLVRDAATLEPVGQVVAKGKSEPLDAYRLVGVTMHGQAPRRTDTPLAGRGSELALLERELELTLADGSCRLVTVLGEPGVGKSRLTIELLERTRGRVGVARGACLSYGEGITFWAVGQIVRGLAGIEDGHSPAQARQRLDTACPDAAVAARLAQLLGLGDGSASADEFTYAIERFLAARAEDGPLLVLFDDVHWAEPALLDLIAELPAKVDAPVLVLTLARPELLDTRPDWPVTVRLEPLAPAELAMLLERLGAPETARERIAHASAGNPLFAEELVAWLGEKEADPDALPASLHSLLGARLDRLDPAARETLERGAIEGELFHQAAVVELSSPASRPSVPAQLDSLTRKDLLRFAAAAGIAGGTAFRFKHILFRDAAYRATPKKLRALLHEQYANWLESFAGSRVAEYAEILGYHLEQAYRYRAELAPPDDETRAIGERAADYLVTAGRRALDRSDTPAVVNLFHRALAIGLSDARERARVQFEIAYPLREAGQISDATRSLNTSIETATRFGERGLAARALVELHLLHIETSPTTRTADHAGTGDGLEAQQVAKQAIRTFAELGDRAGLAQAERLVARTTGLDGGGMRAAYERALTHADAAGDRVTRRRVVGGLANRIRRDPTPVPEAIRRCKELHESSRDDRVLQAVVSQSLASLYAMAGETEKALACVRESSEVLDGLKVRVYSGGVKDALSLVGDRDAEERILTADWPDTEGWRTGSSGPYKRDVLARFYCDEGRWETAAELVAGLDPPELMGYTHEDAMLLAVMARLAAHDGRLDEALAFAERVVERSERTGNLNCRAGFLLVLAEVQRAAGRTTDAEAAVERARSLYLEKGNVVAAARLPATTREYM